MTRLDSAMWDIKSSLNKVLLLDAFLESSVIFLIAYLMISIGGFLSKDTAFAVFMVAIAYFLIRSFFNILQDKVSLVGAQYPDLHEELLTARDYPSTSNQVITDLHEDTIRHVSKIEESSFVNPRSVVIKSMTIIVLCFVILLSAPLNIRELPIVKDTVDKIKNTQLSLSFQTPEQQVVATGPDDAGEFSGKESIFGERRTVEEGIIRAKFEVPTSNFEVNLKEEEDSGDDFSFDSVFPTEIGAPDPELFEESIPKEQQELVKNYFKTSAEG